jgi:hypothetical protein
VVLAKRVGQGQTRLAALDGPAKRRTAVTAVRGLVGGRYQHRLALQRVDFTRTACNLLGEGVIVNFAFADESQQRFEDIIANHLQEAGSWAVCLGGQGVMTETGRIVTPTQGARKVRFMGRQMLVWRPSSGSLRAGPIIGCLAQRRPTPIDSSVFRVMGFMRGVDPESSERRLKPMFMADSESDKEVEKIYFIYIFQ